MVQRLTLWFSFIAPSSEAPVYIEQKSYIPSNTGLQGGNKNKLQWRWAHKFGTGVTGENCPIEPFDSDRI